MATSLYRSLLKALKKHVTNPQFESFIAATFRKHKDVTDPAIVQQQLRLAKDYITLITGVHHHKELLLSYNIGVDRAAEQAATLEKSVRRVGLKMPELYTDEVTPK